ncbi:Rieske 2Fe-2S domain-containing protein, partial [Leptospira sp. 96542]|nr:Rieske 2Fe-2S domain-containing protein [Leptospira sp. 96542]
LTICRSLLGNPRVILIDEPTEGLAPMIVAQVAECIRDMRARGPGAHDKKTTTDASQAARWHDVLALDEIPKGEVRRVDCDGRGLFLYRDKQDGDSTVKAYDSLCPHKATNIPELALNPAGKKGNKSVKGMKGITLTCPKHEWQFDVASGDCIKKGDTPLTRLDSKVEAGRIWVRW